MGTFFTEVSEYKSAVDKIRILTLFKDFLLSANLGKDEQEDLSAATDRLIARSLHRFDAYNPSKAEVFRQYAEQIKTSSNKELLISLMDEFYEEAVRITYLPSSSDESYWAFCEEENNPTEVPLQMKKNVIAYLEQCNNTFMHNYSTIEALKEIHKISLMYSIKSLFISKALKKEQPNINKNDFSD